jgi:hypothetical protein
MSDTPQVTDVRGGHTSASNAAADAACPGRHIAQRGAPESKTVYADSGQRIHAALAAQLADGEHSNRSIVDALPLEERETYQACLDIQRKLAVQHFKGSHAGYREFKEQRYWAKFKVNGEEYQHSGQADFVGRAGTRALIIDYKTEAGDVPESPRNMQLRDLACLVRGTLVPTDEIAVAIVQPFVTHTPEVCVYNRAELEQAATGMFQRVFASNQPDAKRIAGDLQCKFCRARRTSCVEYQNWAAQMTPPAMLNIMGVPLTAWTPAQFSVAAAMLPPAEKFLSELKDLIKERLSKDPASVPGWELKPGAIREAIINPQGVFERFCALGGKIEQFIPCVDLTKVRLREALNKLTSAKGKSLDAAMNTLTDGLVSQKQTAPSLKRKEDAA